MEHVGMVNELIDNAEYMFHMSDIYDVDSKKWYRGMAKSRYGTEAFYKMLDETLEKIMEPTKYKGIFEAEILREEEGCTC